MKCKHILLLFTIFITKLVHAQTTPATELSALDSTQLMQALINLLDSTDAPSSYFTANVAVGNRLFSQQNNTINVKQGTEATTIYTPSIGYNHKSGFNVNAAAFLLNDPANGFTASQFGLTAAYDYPVNNLVSFGASFTKYFVKDKFSVFASPIQNDLYGYFSYNKYWLNPGIAVGYSTGEYKQYISKDTVINNRRRLIYDSITNNLKAFSVMLSVSHNFQWQKIFTKKDGVDFTPSFMLNLGSSKINITHRSNAINLLNALTKRGKLRKNISSPFQAESIGFNADISYLIGKFSLQPQWYVDYYLLETDTQRFSQVFTFNIGYSF
jgi:hypothetical protein